MSPETRAARPVRYDHNSFRRLVGNVAATPTPFDSDGNINHASVRALADYLIKSGIAALAPSGGTGEYTALSEKQRVEMVAVTVEAAAGAVPVVGCILSPGLGDALTVGRKMLAEGVDGLMVLAPYFIRPTQDGIIDYYKAVSDRLDTNIVLYEIPYRTGVSLLPETIAKIVETTRVVAMKACNPDLTQQMKVAELVADKICILSGEEDMLPLHVANGARGGFLAGACIFPKLFAQIVHDARSGNLAKARELHVRLRPALAALFCEPNPAPLKAALETMGLCTGGVLPPLRNASQEARNRLAAVIPAMLKLEESLDLAQAA